ncbi:MAG: hypothetical protein II289_04545, partial [Bacteroidales bacterium]|nr:hypothetical protein [Bacteroidales bacterium]
MDSKERIAKALAISTDTKVFEMAQGASACVPEVFQKCFPGRKAAVVADINTWPALGEKVYEAMKQAGIVVEKYIIDKQEFHADWKYVEMVDRIIEGDFAAAKATEDATDYVDTLPEKLFREASDDFYVLVSVGSGV